MYVIQVNSKATRDIFDNYRTRMAQQQGDIHGPVSHVGSDLQEKSRLLVHQPEFVDVLYLRIYSMCL